MCENGGSIRKLCCNKTCNHCLENSFASSHRANFWSNKNEKNPREILKGSDKNYIFNCDICPHEFSSNLRHIKASNRWCPYCSNQKLCDNNDCDYCFNKSFAKHPKSEFWSNKNEKKPRDYFLSSEHKVYFDCDQCKHTFHSMIGNISRLNRWCSFCSNTFLCDDTDCKICFEKSFASSDKAKYWSEKNEILPRDIFKKTNTKYLFDCNKCKHTFEKELSKITIENSWCQYCAHQKLCDDNDCEYCFDNCFESHPKAKYWSKKNTKHPGDVFKKSGTKYWFDCHKCGHDYEKILCDMDRYDCPYCGSQQLCSNTDCQVCLKKSFASSDKAKYLNPENKIDPRTLFISSEKKHEFICEKGHKFSSALNKITCDNTWCPSCINKTETKLYDWLCGKYTNVEKQKRFEWCKNKKCLPYDFYLPEYNLLIELDGNQHFEQIQNWQSPEKTQETDIYKNEKAIENGLSIIRIVQTDIWNNINQWDLKLCEKIQKYDNPILIKIGNKY